MNVKKLKSPHVQRERQEVADSKTNLSKRLVISSGRGKPTI
jgi:hypothetical protein